MYHQGVNSCYWYDELSYNFEYDGCDDFRYYHCYNYPCYDIDNPVGMKCMDIYDLDLGNCDLDQYYSTYVKHNRYYPVS